MNAASVWLIFGRLSRAEKIIEYRPDDYRCPSCLVLGVNLAGRWLHVVCGIHEDALWILTAYWPDLDHWNASYTERKKKGE